jgi:hypothetical protein
MNSIQTSQFRVGEQVMLDNELGVIKLFDTDVAAILTDVYLRMGVYSSLDPLKTL